MACSRRYALALGSDTTIRGLSMLALGDAIPEVYALFQAFSVEEGAAFNQKVIGVEIVGVKDSQIDELAKGIGKIGGQKSVRIIRRERPAGEDTAARDRKARGNPRRSA